jgi:Flp pilus assembly protein TadG
LRKPTFNPRKNQSGGARRGGRLGAVLVETVLVLPALLFPAFGMAEFGEFYNVRAAFEAAAVAAARQAIPATAQQGDPAAAATSTLANSGVTFNAAWMTITDYTNSNAVVSDVSQINPGHMLIFTIQTNYSQLPSVYRPLYSMTGIGIGNSKTVFGQCSMVKE